MLFLLTVGDDILIDYGNQSTTEFVVVSTNLRRTVVWGSLYENVFSQLFSLVAALQSPDKVEWETGITLWVGPMSKHWLVSHQALKPLPQHFSFSLSFSLTQCKEPNNGFSKWPPEPNARQRWIIISLKPILSGRFNPSFNQWRIVGCEEEPLCWDDTLDEWNVYVCVG